MRPLIVLVTAYLLGSIPFGYLIVRASKGIDVRDIGSGGTGATNVTRRAGKGAGLLTLLLDTAKGGAAVWLARLALASESEAAWWMAAAAVLVLAGHIFPVWLKFRGGKGVATGLGVFLVLAPIAVIGAASVFLLIVGLTRFVSLASIGAVLSLPLIILLQHIFAGPVENLGQLIIIAVAGASLIIFAHRGNIGRLVRGTEPRFGTGL
ncbi:MAG TPA: glycerol-3-phosphate 1-O-acyltransferase PlsY [Pyrinomonadaceae bacterium]|nr:glycerol-3-phosphate 1-O-acyltransferase PlsY [Pyrinomonadaceae bacterium]